MGPYEDFASGSAGVGGSSGVYGDNSLNDPFTISSPIQSNNKSSGFAFLSVLGQVISSALGYLNQRNVNYHNEQLAQRQNEWSIAQWLRENSWNSPVSQKNRLLQAGLNSGLIYGNGGITNLGATSPEMVSSQGRATADFSNPFSQFATDMKTTELLQSQIDLNQSQANKNNAQAGLITTETDIAGVRFKIISKNGETLSDLQIETMRKGIEELSTKIDNLNADTAVKLLEGERLRNYIDQIQPAELVKIQSETGLNEAQTKQILDLLSYEIALKKAIASNQYAQAHYANAQATWQDKLNNSDEYVQEFINSIRISNEGKIVDMDINLGSNLPSAKVGASATGHYKGSYANVARPATGSDQAINGIGTIFGTVGRLFSLIGKF